MQVELRFGIELRNEAKNWDERNARLIYDSLTIINEVLNGHLKSLVGGATFKLGNQNPKEGEYHGWTTHDKTITFYTIEKAAIRQMNIFHEFGHLLDSLSGPMFDVFSSALQSENRSFIGENGYINSSALSSESIKNDPNYPSVQAIQASRANDDEQWADVFANYVAGNINMNVDEGRDMDKFIRDVLAPYIGVP